MKCTFYYAEDVNLNEWNEIRDKLRKDLKELETGTVTEQEAVNYLETLLPMAKPLERNPAMRFFGFDKPEHMPSDARVDYFYWPTYLAAALTMKACQLYPGILERISLPDSQDAMRIAGAVLLACSGRRFQGHGYESLQGMIEVMELFISSGAMDFIRHYGSLSPEFTRCLKDALDFLMKRVMQGDVSGPWGDDYTDRAHDILVKAGMLPEGEDAKERE